MRLKGYACILVASRAPGLRPRLGRIVRRVNDGIARYSPEPRQQSTVKVAGRIR
jgi:hypothetical protein